MVCIYCGNNTQVTNSRLQKRSNQVWRRRRCLNCQAVFTTLEAIDLPSTLLVVSGASTAPATAFLPDMLYEAVSAALRGHNSRYIAAREVTNTVIKQLLQLSEIPLLQTKQISQETAKVLKRFDAQAYLRYVAEHPSLQ